MSKNYFTHLHIHDHYSLLDGAMKTKDMVARAKELNMSHLAQTNHGNMFGSWDFYKECKKAGINPITGMEAYVAPTSCKEKTKIEGEQTNHMTILAMNEQGYRNLLKLSTIAYLEGFYYKPRIDEELLKKYNEGLIITSGCVNGRVTRYARLAHEEKSKAHLDKAYAKAQEYKDIFGDRFYIEAQHNGYDSQECANKITIPLAKDLGIKVVATADAHYVTKEEAAFHDQLMCLQMNQKVTNPDRLSACSARHGLLYVASADDMAARFKDIPGAVATSMEIAERCNVELQYDDYILPEFEVPKQYKNPHEYLTALTEEGLKRKFGSSPPDSYVQRFRYELGVIKEMGFSIYFLVVSDYIKWARDNNIIVGPGRGSAAGSLVAFCLSITDIDPLKYDLLFERFLNPGRNSMPDIDTDFCRDRRDEVIQYVKDKYNTEDETRVAQIGTFSTFKTKGAIRDFVRVQDKPYSYGDSLSKMVPPPKHGIDLGLEQVLSMEPEFNKPEHKEVMDMVKKSDGMVKNVGVHAAGVVMADRPLTDLTALFVSKHSKKEPVVATQFEMNDVEDLGLIKFDFLGLRNLTSIQKTIEIIDETQDIQLNINDIPLDHDGTFNMLSRGDTIGVFQLEQSTGITELTRRIKPRSVSDIGVINALYRPGPLGSGDVEHYVRRRHKHEQPAYRIPELEPILKDTYGVLVYQEQVIKAAVELAGFTPSEADDLRKAVGKKIAEKMAEQKEKFISGCGKNDISQEDAEKVFADIEEFASYGFNKSHAIAYAMVGYQTAYLKHKYPVEFLCALMCTEDKQEKIIKYISACRKSNIEVLPPDVNASNEEFTVSGNSIRFGFTAIKDVGLTAIRKIIQARRHGPFESLDDFIDRVDGSKVNRKVIDALIEAGAFDSMGHKRSISKRVLEDLIKYYKKYDTYKQKLKDFNNFEKEYLQALSEGKKIRKKRQPKEPVKVVPPVLPEYDEDALVRMEKDRVGFYITSNPLLRFMENNPQEMCDVTTGNILEECYNNSQASMLGLISNIRIVRTKRGEEMGIFTLEDLEGILEVIVFPKYYRRYKHMLNQDNIVKINGNVNIEVSGEGDSTVKLFLNSISDLSNIHKRSLKVNLMLTEDYTPDNIQLMAHQVYELVHDNAGDTPLYLYMGGLGMHCGNIQYTQELKLSLAQLPDIQIKEIQ